MGALLVFSSKVVAFLFSDFLSVKRKQLIRTED